MFAFWTKIKQNPVYQRERGRWGEPNRFFATLNRYSPFLIIGIFVFTVCCGFNSSLIGLDSNLTTFWAILCLPNLAMQGLMWAVVLLVPALTAPSISEEMKQGTWDILRLTPQPMSDILLAKVFGGLARLKIWWPMLIVSLFQMAGAVLGIVTVQAFESTGENLFVVILLAVAVVTRPWLEVLCVALIGINFSAVAGSARTALVGSYAVILFLRLFIYLGSFVFSLAISEITGIGSGAVSVTNSLSTALYFFLALGLLLLLYWQAKRLSFGDQKVD